MTTKLTPEIVTRLRALAATGQLSTREAARAYGVGQETIRRAVRGETFATAQTPPALAADAAASEARMRSRFAQQPTDPLEEL